MEEEILPGLQIHCSCFLPYYITSQETVILTTLVPDRVGRLHSKLVTRQIGERLRYVASKSVMPFNDGISWMKSQVNPLAPNDIQGVSRL